MYISREARARWKSWMWDRIAVSYLFLREGQNIEAMEEAQRGLADLTALASQPYLPGDGLLQSAAVRVLLHLHRRAENAELAYCAAEYEAWLDEERAYHDFYAETLSASPLLPINATTHSQAFIYSDFPEC